MAITICRIDAAEAIPLRRKVLWPNHPVSYSMVEGEEAGWHFGARQDGVLVCVASVFIEQGSARLRKFAALQEYRSRGIGSALLTSILSSLREAGIRRFWCDARLSAVRLYRRFGMSEEGCPFQNESIPYVRMGLTLVDD